MPIYNLEGLRAQADESLADASDAELIVEYSRAVGKDPQEVAEYLGVKTGRGGSAFGTGVAAGVDQTQGLFASAGMALADAAGFEGLRQNLEGEVRQQESEGMLARNPEIPQRVEDIDGAGSAIDWGFNQFGQQVPIMGGIIASSLATGGIGGLTAAGAARTGLSASANRLARKGLLNSTTAGGVGAGYAYGVGSLYGESVEGGAPNARGAVLGGAPYSLLEAAVPLAGGALARGARLGLPTTSRTARAGQAAAGGALTEGVTESLQTELEMDMRDDLTPEEEASRRLNAFLSGAIVGGGFSGAAGGLVFQPKRDGQGETDLTGEVTDEQRVEDRARFDEFETERAADPIPSEQVVDELEEAGDVASLERLASMRMDAKTKRTIRAEIALAREQLEELNKQAPIDEDLSVLEMELDALNAAVDPNKQLNKKRLGARRYKQKLLELEEKAAATAEQRAELTQAVLDRKYELALENGEVFGEAVTLDKRIKELEDALETEARTKLARSALQRQKRRGASAEETQADFESRIQNRAASLEQVPIPTETEVQPVVQPEATVDPAPIAEAPMQVVEPPAEPIDVVEPVVDVQPDQTMPQDDELLTEEQILQSEEATAATISDPNKLNAAVVSDPTKVKGKITLGQPVIAAAARHLRSPKPDGFSNVYEEGTATVSQQATSDAKDQLDSIRAAALKVAGDAARYNNAANNILNLSADADIDSGVDAKAELSFEKRENLRNELVKSLEAFVTAAGGRPNANAIIAAYKATREKSGKGNPSRNLNKVESDFVNSIVPGRGGRKFKKLGGFTGDLDTLLSNSFNQYVNDKLTVSPDIAPNSLPVRDNKKMQSKEDKSGIRLTDKDLQENVEKGRQPNNLTTKVADGIIKGINAARDAKLAELQAQRDAKKINQSDYFKQRKALNDQAEAEIAAKQKTIDDRIAANKGLRALVNRALDTGTRNVTERFFAKMIRRVLDARDKAGVPEPNIVFGDESSFDPKESPGGTITLARETSPEIVLHEVLHALLQGFIYNNRKAGLKSVTDPATVETIDVLRGYVRALVNMDISTVPNLTAAEKKKSTEVINTLKTIISEGGANAEVDAVLELVSYGNTLRDFKTMLGKMDRVRSKPNSEWQAILKGIWRIINELLNKLIGRPKNDSAANDILAATIELLQDTADNPQASKPVARYGSKLNYRASTSKTNTRQDPLKDFRAQGKEATYGITKPLFMAIGNMIPESVPSNIKKLVGEVKNAVMSKPRLEMFTRWFNPNLGFGENLRDIFRDSKKQKHTPIQLAEHVSRALRNMVETNPETADKYIAYLDGDKNALEGVVGRERLEDMADLLIESFETMVEALPDGTAKSFFTGRNFTEALAFVSKSSDVGSGNIGIRKLNTVLGSKVLEESVLDADWVGLNAANDTLDTNAIYYPVYETDENGQRTSVKANFIREDILRDKMAEAGESDGAFYENLGEAGERRYVADMSAKWSPNANGNKFTSNMTVAEARKLFSKKDAADNIGIALLNTANTLSSFYSSKNMFSSMAKLGRKADGSIDPNSGDAPVMFKSLGELNDYREANGLEGIAELNPDDTERILVANSNDMKNGTVRGKLRKSGTFVKMPESSELKDAGLPVPVWGELAGTIIPGPVYSAMLDMGNRENVFSSEAGQKYNAFLRQFKLSKTTRNPGTHITNVASNLSLMMMHGIQFKTVREAAGILYKASRTPEKLTASERRILKEFEKSGALLGNFSATEVKQQVYERTGKALEGAKEGGVADQIANLLDMETGKFKYMGKAINKLGKLDEGMLEMYAAEDNVFRLASVMTRVGQMQTENNSSELTDAQWNEVGKTGREDFLNYDIDAIALQYARQTILPFASWTYAVMPVLGKIMVTKPWMIANVLTSYAILDGLLAAMSGDDEEKRKQLGDMYNDRIFGFGPHSMIRIPGFGDDDNPVYWRIGDYIPLASTVRGIPAGTFGYGWWPQGIAPSGPMISVVAMMLQTDPYTGKKLNDPTESNTDITMRNVGLLYDLMAPPALAVRNWGRMGDYIDGAQSPSGRDVSSLFIARALGAKFYQPNMQDESFWKKISEGKLKREYGAAISAAKRDTIQKAAPDYEEYLSERMRLKSELDNKIDELYNRD